MLIHFTASEKHRLKKVATFAYLHNQILVAGILKNIVQLHDGGILLQLLHEPDLSLHSQEIFLLHFGFLICLDDHWPLCNCAHRSRHS